MHILRRTFFRTFAGTITLGLWMLIDGPHLVWAQSGFERIEGRYVDIITDLPLTEDLRELPTVFEHAMPTWCRVFDVEPTAVADWHAEAFIMLERERFVQAGLLPGNLPDFPYGFQFGNQMWVGEQPSPYYRRHLLLHEGTHWFMTRLYGSSGPPWLMEGMAEWLGTHSWDSANQKLAMGFIPSDKDQVPYWGRMTRIQNQLALGRAPSLESIMRYGQTAHRNVDAYAWSWAAVVFLQNHPNTQETFRGLLKQPMRPDAEMTRWFYKQSEHEWPAIREQWRGTVTDLDYGYSVEPGMLVFSSKPTQLGRQLQTTFCGADRNWQPSGLLVSNGQRVKVESTGRFTLAQEPEPWICTADGVTLEYHQGEPLGRLLVSIVAPRLTEPQHTLPLRQEAVGSAFEFEAWETGELQFRINESPGALSDNTGQLKVTVVSTSPGQ